MDILIELGLVIAVIIISMALHELMHGLVAYWLGDTTAKSNGRLTLNPIKHIDPFLSLLLPLVLAISGGPIFGGAKPVPINPHNLRWKEWGMALVAFAGPLTNFVLSFLFFTALVIIQPSGLLSDFLALGFRVNIGFCIFNLLPIPPLDGSRILYAIAPDGVRRIMASIEQYGLIIVFAMIFILGGVFGQFMAFVINEVFQLFASLFGLR